MTTHEARAFFDQAIGQAKNADQVARIELCREYFTNPAFRKGLEDEVARINGVAA